MNWTLWRNMIFTACAFLAVASCGSGGGGSVASGGTGGTGISFGTVTGFGSVYVNDVKFSTTNTSVELDGVSCQDEVTSPDYCGLKVGMVVKVEGEFDDDDQHGTATEIEYEDNLEGPVDSITAIDATTKQMMVLGQTVILDVNQTHFENTAFDTLAPGDFVEVSGLVDDTGSIRATYVALKTPGEMEVKGTIENLGATTFQIKDLIVNYSSAELPSDALANGQYVEVKGISYDSVTVTLIATEVELDDDMLGATDADEAEVEGYITDVTPPNQFTVGTQVIQTTASTVLEGTGSIAVGTKVEVEGSLVGGVLTATEISFD